MSRPVTRAKNAHQHPRKILFDLEPKCRSRAEVAQEKEQFKLTKKELVQAMKLGLAAAAKVENKNAREDIEDNIPMLPPSQRHQVSKKDSPDIEDGREDSVAPIPSQWRQSRLACRESSLKVIPDSEDEEESVGSKESKKDEQGIDGAIGMMCSSQLDFQTNDGVDEGIDDRDINMMCSSQLDFQADDGLDGGIDDGADDGDNNGGLEESDIEELVSKKKKKAGNNSGIRGAIVALRQQGSAASDLTLAKPQYGINSWRKNVHKPNYATTNEADELSTNSQDVSSLFPITTDSTACTSHPNNKKRVLSSQSTSNTWSATNEGTGIGYWAGGLEDEVEIEEYIEAVKGKRTISTNLVEFRDGVKPPLKHIKVEHPTRITNSDLPEGCMEGGRWCNTFITMYEKWVGTCENPWNISDTKAVWAMQLAWDAIYPNICHTITVQDPVYLVASQRLSEWQSGFGSTAMAMVEHFFESDPAYTTYHARQEFASEVLTGFAYLYEEIGDDPLGFCGLFRSPFVLQTFAAHFAAVNTSIDVEVLRAVSVPSNATDTKKYPPVGALAMSAAAVERAFTMWAERKITWDPPVTQSQVPWHQNDLNHS
ncbi:hypothetical protein SERLA73DRAFT_151647 [Serpula lacrymans var. lacrymans S7.3]|uniref:DUF6532 domain-containing protein n=1 Tax=Serpula lacrymans var. lacrymans (strain S7.3) TaxID=936435 RepID=F8PTV6_SERL3|nr:hypothetical protein SERLA73DRAFT_151647 [Serpula lacrymans var. lacrymans S7.3]